jgi:hypothetical protein
MRRYIMKTVQNKSFRIPDVGRNSGKRTLMSRFKIVLCSVLVVLAIGNQKVFGQGVGISEVAPITPHASSILELQSTNKGFLAPRMTTAERIAISSPANGLLVYDTTTESFWYYDAGSSSWKAFIGGGVAWGSSNQLLGMNAAGTSNEYKTLQGTANRISVTFTPGLITLSTPQDIHTGATPTFAGLTLTTTPLGVSSGGTGLNTFGGSNTVLFTSTANNLTWVATSTAPGQFLQTTAAGGAPTWKSVLSVVNGGTGLSSGISGGIPYFNSTTTMASSALLSANGVVIGGGAGTAPSTIGVGAANTVLRGTGAAPVFGQIVNGDITNGTIDLTTKVTGILPLKYGGTNADLSALASNGGIVWSNATQMQILAGTATPNKMLLSGASGMPSWSSYTMPPLFGGAGQIMYTSNANTVTNLAAGTAGTYLRSNGAAAPSWNRINLASSTEVMNILPLANGGTNTDLSGGAAVGDILYANTASTFARLADIAVGNVLLSGGVGLAPSWGKVGLTTHVSGVLQEVNGGTGESSYSPGDLLIGNNAGGLDSNPLTGTTDQVYVANGDGTITLSLPQSINTTSTVTFANIYDNGLSTNSGVYTDGSSMLTSTPPNSGTIGYWTRDDALDLLTPANLGDDVATTDGGTITSSGLLTGEAGATVSGADINLNASSDFATNINTGTSTGDITIGNSGNDIVVPKFNADGVVHNDAGGVLFTDLIRNADIGN